MLTVFGSVALDTIHTQYGVACDIMGGSSTYAALSASRFTETGLVAVAGTDFPDEYIRMLEGAVDTRGLRIVPGKTFRYAGRYQDNFDTRVDLGVEPNVTMGNEPAVPPEYQKSRFVYLANTDPIQQASVLERFPEAMFTMCDTINHWIDTQRDDVVRLAGMVDAVIMNDGEARRLTGHHDLVRCAQHVMGWGAEFVIIKKAEHGSILFHADSAYPLPGIPATEVIDPTGAGDAFAGAVMGYLDSVGRAGVDDLRRACVYGNVMGSFVVSRAGVEGLASLSRDDIEGRAERYRRMISVE